MSHEPRTDYGGSPAGAMQRAMGRDAQNDIIREALERIDGKPAPEMGAMQAAMGRESQVRIAAQAIRSYLDERGYSNIESWMLKSNANVDEPITAVHAVA